MNFSISTRWNAFRHSDGEAMLSEILDLGFKEAELGYDLMFDLVPGVLRMVESKAIKISSVHNYCPVPIGITRAHPEIFTLTSTIEEVRRRAVHHTMSSLEFAVSVGASAVVVHAGYVEMDVLTSKLIKLCENGEQFSPAYDKIRLNLLMSREKKAQPCLDQLRKSLNELVPIFTKSGVKLALENLPYWEAIPTEPEAASLLDDYDTGLARWHDTGHAQLRQKLGLVAPIIWLRKHKERLAGMHLHDLTGVFKDHIMPPKGEVDFVRLAEFIRPRMPLVLEPAQGTDANDIKEGVAFLKKTWEEKINQ